MMKRILSFIGMILAAMGFFWIVILVGQAVDWGARTQVISTLPSPGDRAVAYLIDSSGSDAAPVQSVRIGRSGDSPRHGDRVLEMVAGSPRVSLAWTGVDELTITIPCGRFSHAANFWSDAGRKLTLAVNLRFPVDCPQD